MYRLHKNKLYTFAVWNTYLVQSLVSRDVTYITLTATACIFHMDRDKMAAILKKRKYSNQFFMYILYENCEDSLKCDPKSPIH